MSPKAVKKQTQRDNTRCEKRVQKQVKANVEFLKQLGWFEEKNKNVPTTPSYSMMHSLQDDLSIVLYSKTHDTESSPEIFTSENGTKANITIVDGTYLKRINISWWSKVKNNYTC